MNIVLLERSEWLSTGEPFEVALDGRRAKHIIQVLKLQAGDSLRIGCIDASIGTAQVSAVAGTRPDQYRVCLHIDPAQCLQHPPPPSPVNLIVALPRPKTARRMVRTASELGIKHLHFINSYKVEKSYWQSPLLAAYKLREQVLMGLEQSSDTVLPEITFHPRFKPFIEDKFAQLVGDAQALLALPAAAEMLASIDCRKTHWIVIGPEGGFTSYENNRLAEAGCRPVSLGQRILRTETVLPFVAGLTMPGAG